MRTKKEASSLKFLRIKSYEKINDPQVVTDGQRQWAGVEI